jgi:hypothetical protein
MEAGIGKRGAGRNIQFEPASGLKILLRACSRPAARPKNFLDIVLFAILHEGLTLKGMYSGGRS